MKLIHIADTHIGIAAFKRLDPESGINLREKQVYDNFLSAIEAFIREKPDRYPSTCAHYQAST